MNGYINANLFVENPDTHEAFTTDLLSTLQQRVQLASAPVSVQNKFDDPEHMISESEIRHARTVAKYLDIPEDHLVLHWWNCFELGDGSKVHFDHCGPAYGLLDYERTICGNRSPVFAILAE